MQTNQAIKAPANAQAMVPNEAVKPAVKRTDALGYLQSETFKSQLAMALPKFFDTDRFVRSAISEFRLNPALAQCSIPSVLGYYMQAAMCGLEPASVLGQCYAVPFNNKKTGQKECQFILGYRGMAAIARRSGEVMSIDAQIVHEKDDFELVYGVEQSLKHKPYLDGNPGAMRGAYCVVRFKDGSYQYRYMPKSEIDAHRGRSKASSSGPWVSDYEEMAKKTVFRALFKWLPVTIEQAQATAADDSVARYEYKPGAVPEDELNIEYSVANDEPGESERATQGGEDA